MNKKYQNIIKIQERSGWCGPAVIQMVLASAGIKLSQARIAKDVYLPWWGTPHDTIFAYLSQFFSQLDFKADSTPSDIESHLNHKEVVIVNWWDDIDSEDADGHYSLVFDYLPKVGQLVINDPARGIVKMRTPVFTKRWYDYLDIAHKKKVSGWMLWVNPKSKIIPTFRSRQ